jgi:hypothetical protein
MGQRGLIELCDATVMFHRAFVKQESWQERGQLEAGPLACSPLLSRLLSKSPRQMRMIAWSI